MEGKISATPSKRVARIMLEAENHKLHIDIKQHQLNMARSKLQNEIIEAEVDEYLLDDGDDKFLSASVYYNRNLQYDKAKLKERLARNQLREVCDSILVVDEAGLSSFLRQYPELRSELTKFIHKVSEVNIDKLNLAYERGIITKQDIKGCYTVTKRPVLKLVRKKR